MTISVVGFVFSLIGCLLAGVIGGYFLSRKIFTDQLKKNPPISRDMIKAMYRSMGRQASEKDINKTMKAMEDARN